MIKNWRNTQSSWQQKRTIRRYTGSKWRRGEARLYAQTGQTVQI